MLTRRYVLASGLAAPAPLVTSLFNYRFSPAGGGDAWPGVEILHNAERTNYPLAMAVDDTGEAFRLTALAERLSGTFDTRVTVSLGKRKGKIVVE